ncbi:MAG: AAA family ATPase [Chthonomonas sp.]|nr:AAA family ATPase [Chthonomonas sp.]
MAAIEPQDFMSIFTDGIPQFLDILPPVIREKLQHSGALEEVIEVVLDYGRPAEVRYRDRIDRFDMVTITEHDIDFVVKSVGEFSLDNRAGIERTLHRISCLRNRQGKIIGLTCRVGRALEGTIDLIDDIVRSGKSLLLLGKPGIGKTTKLRETARVLADEVGKRVVIVDTSNEIAGDGDVPHPAIGSARRMQVANPLSQHAVMIEAVENHMPEVIVIDEIGTEAEAAAARTIAERGVQLVGTAHGQTLENLMLNPTLCDLVGGIQAVTLSDDEARRRGTQKTVLERKAPPTFDVVVELLDFDRLAVHSDVMKTVDLILRGIPPRPEIRVRTGSGQVEVVQEELVETTPVESVDYPALSRKPQAEAPQKAEAKAAPKLLRIFPYGIARTRLDRAIREKKAAAYITNDPSQADAVISIRGTNGKGAKIRDLGKGVPMVVVKSNTYAQILGALEELLGNPRFDHDLEVEALAEAAKAIEQVAQLGKPVELAPRSARIRRVQHQLVESKRYASESVGEDPQRRLRILPTRL